MTQTWNILSASSTLASVTKGWRAIFERLSEIRTTASSCLTVMGMAKRFSPSSSTSLLEFLIRTYRFFNFSAASSVNLGPQRALPLHLLLKTRSGSNKIQVEHCIQTLFLNQTIQNTLLEQEAITNKSPKSHKPIKDLQYPMYFLRKAKESSPSTALSAAAFMCTCTSTQYVKILDFALK